MTERAFACVVVLIAAASTPLTAHLSPLTLQDTTSGKAVYAKGCAGCHDDGGEGDGPSAAQMLRRPRKHTGSAYKIASPAFGQLTTDADLVRARVAGV